MKKWLVVLLASMCMVLALAGCSQGGEQAEPEEQGNEVGMGNPWTDVATAEEAAQGAGLDSFDVPLGTELEIGLIDEQYATFRCMEGIAQMDCPVGAVEMTIRKGLASAATDENAPAAGDISGDYGEYAHTWTQNVKGLEVTCFGNRENEATKTIWTLEDTCYSITAFGAGGDDDFGLSPDDVNSLVNGIQ